MVGLTREQRAERDAARVAGDLDLDRIEREMRERRERPDGTLDQSMDMKLSVPQAAMDRYGERYRLRWVNDTGSRIYNLTERQYWLKVPGVDPRPVGTDEHGKPIKAHLLMKLKEFDAQDQARKDVARREVERSALQGAPTDPEGRDVAEAANLYVPEGNRLTSSYSP